MQNLETAIHLFETAKRNKEDVHCFPNSYITANMAVWLKKLKAYEDAEEQGLLMRLPCKVGDTVYKLWHYDGKPYKIQQHVIRTLSEICGLIESKKLGKSVFLTKLEAEKKLKEKNERPNNTL